MSETALKTKQKSQKDSDFTLQKIKMKFKHCLFWTLKRQGDSKHFFESDSHTGSTMVGVKFTDDLKAANL